MLLDNLQKGDLLFQLRTGGELEYVISRLFAGYNNMALNHVGIYCGNGELVEAIMPQVKTTAVDHFIQRSVADTQNRPCVLQARLIPEYAHLTDAAVTFARELINEPYDNQYCDKRKGWYCSELVLEAFRYANDGCFVFPQTPMGFRDLETGELFPYWAKLYQKAGKPVPEGEPGSHPALLSRSEKLDVINISGQLPARQNPVTRTQYEQLV